AMPTRTGRTTRCPCLEPLERRTVPSHTFHRIYPIATASAFFSTDALPPTPPPMPVASLTTSGPAQMDLQNATDPGAIRVGGTYYLFTTGSGIPIRTSTDLVHWKPIGAVFASNIPGWAQTAVPGATFPWAPEVASFGGQYHLYYAVSQFGTNRSVIGHATNAT